MDLTTLLYLTGATGFFSSRAFIPAFFTALFIRYGDKIPFAGLGDQPFIQITGGEPTWFTSNLTLLVLGVLAATEVVSTKLPEAGEMLEEVQKYSKTAMAALATMGVLSTRDVAFIEGTMQQAGMFDLGVAGIVAAAVHFMATIRAGVMELLEMADPDDDFGIRTLIAWFEDLWASFGIYLLIVYPIVIVAVLGVIYGTFAAIRKMAQHREDKARVPCPSCTKPVYGCAPECPSCHHTMESPRDVGFLGTTVQRPAAEPVRHSFRLMSKRRCPKCAQRVEERKLPTTCSACSHEILGNEEDRRAYFNRVRGRLPKVLGITFLLSLIPVLGIIPGIIYYRVQLVSPFRMYIPASRGLALKWLVRLIFLGLISLQLIPGLGGLMVPSMALISYSLYAGYFNRMLVKGSPATAA